MDSIGSFKLNLTIAQLFGVPLFLHKTPTSCKWLIILNCLLCSTLFNVGYIMCEIRDLIENGNDFGKIAQNACLTVTHIGGNVKFLNILLKIREVRVLVEEMQSLQSQFVSSDEHQKSLKSSEFENKLILVVYFSVVAATGFLGLGVLLRDPSVGGNNFPFRALLPRFLTENSRIIYWWLGISILAIQIVAIDSLNLNLMNQIRFHLKLLNIDLAGLTASTPGIDFQDSLRNCVNHHQYILRLRNDIDEIFKYPTLVQFVVSLFIFVMTGFHVTTSSRSDGAIIIYCYCTCILCQLFAYCWFNNQVVEEYKLLVFGCYSTSWLYFGPKNTKMLLIFMINAQKPLTFTVGGFFNLSLNAFAGILSRSYSFIAVLRQVYAK